QGGYGIAVAHPHLCVRFYAFEKSVFFTE
ncbi:hypothetical protein EZS27_037204, partial [termite gut metagenome]